MRAQPVVSSIVVVQAMLACGTDTEGTRRAQERATDRVTVDADAGTKLVDAAPAVRDDTNASAASDAGADASVAASPCFEAAKRWSEIAQGICAGCHGPNSAGAGGFATVLDTQALIDSGKVVPDFPEDSLIYQRLEKREMPPASVQQRLSEEDIAAVYTWIQCGTPEGGGCTADCTSFVSIDARLAAMVSDTQKLATPEQRKNVRYIDLSSYANAGHGDRKLELFRAAISYLLNSLSTAEKVVVPVAIDAQKLIFRVELSAYGFTPAKWETLVADYPYAVRYDATSRTFPSDEEAAETLRQATGTQVPYIQADWFFSHAARPPLYHTLLNIPATLSGLESQLGIKVQANINAGKVVRAGFRDSGPSRFNRVVEQHVISPERGAVWITYDFNAGAGTSNIFSHPLDFVEASSEILFSLPNGMQGYMIVDGAGKRLDKAPANAVLDPLSRDLAIENGMSCMSCHAETGTMVVRDEIRASTLATSIDVALVDRVLAIYPEQPVLDAAYAADGARYLSARKAARGQFANGVVHTLDQEHLKGLDLRAVAGVLGVDPFELAKVINEAPGTFPPELVVLTSLPTARIQRQNFEVLFPELVTTLGLGQIIP